MNIASLLTLAAKLPEIIQALARLKDLILFLIDQADALLPEGGKGATKLEIVRAGIADAWDALGDIKASFEDAWPVVKAFIASLVKARNLIGASKKP